MPRPREMVLERIINAGCLVRAYNLYLAERGNVPDMFRTVAHRPEIFRTMIAHFRAIMTTGTVPAKLKELVIVRTSQINRCEY
jgi:alkylhydroperoxidase family enzyme